MNRRTLLSLVGTSSAAAAGCMGLGQSSDSQPTTAETSTPKPNPQISWSEEWLQGTKYSVTASVQLNGASQVMVKKGGPSGNTIATIESNGEHQVVGPETDHGPIEAGRMLWVVRPSLSEYSDRPMSVTSYTPGSQEQATFPLHLRGLSGSTDPDLSDSGFISRTFNQNTNGTPTSFSVKVPEVLYQYYKGRRRVPEYGAYVSDTYDDQYIKGLVDEFERYGEQQGFGDPGIINGMMQFVQNLEYTSDQVSAGYNEYPKYPVETLVDEGGDCEDTCILLASMLEQFGYGSVLLIFPDKQHMALGIAGSEGLGGTYYQKDGQRYYYVETTAPGWRIGELPPDMEGGSPRIGRINNHGLLVFSYVVDTPAQGGAVTEVSMMNVGDAAGTARASVAFQNQDGGAVVSKESDGVEIGPQKEKTVTVRTAPPDDETLRAKVMVEMDGTLQDSLTSNYQEPPSS